MSEEKGGRYKIIRTVRTVRSSNADAPVGKINRGACTFLTDKVAVETPLPEKAKKLAIAFAEISDVFRLTFLERIEKEKDYVGIYEHYERIFEAVRKTADGLEDRLKVAYLFRAAGLFRQMKNGLPHAPFAYEVLGKCVAEDKDKADEFVAKAIAAKDNETLPKICREYGC